MCNMKEHENSYLPKYSLEYMYYLLYYDVINMCKQSRTIFANG